MIKMITTLFATSLLSGCFLFGNSNGSSPDYGPAPTKSPTTGAVVIGVEISDFAGACPGSRVDSTRMTQLWSLYTDNVVTLVDKTATRAAVISALEDAVSKYELVCIYYSGHGGSGGYSAQEADETNEFLCLYDGALLDDKIWEIISKSKGRVFLMFDCCHSQTMFRSNTITLGKAAKRARRKFWQKKNKARTEVIMEDSSFQMLCWSGCPDNTVSYGSGAGGMFTLSLLQNLRHDSSYADVWKKISKDRWLLNAEIPQQTIIGDWDQTKLLFK
jgi:hypothetical protein